MRPVIGVTGPDRGGIAAWMFTALAVRRAGGRPVRIRPKRKRGFPGLDGLIIGGGADISPSLYGQTPNVPMGEMTDTSARGWRRALGYLLFPLLWLLRRTLTRKHGGVDPARDALEQDLVQEALAQQTPLLGICRGMQLINVALDGTLHQSLEGFYDEVPAIRSVLPRKRVALAPDSRLRVILGRDQCSVNALHHQAIDRLGEGLAAAAREPSGVLQGYEGTGRHWLIGVQWHPEYLPQRPEQQVLFRALVVEAAGAPR